MLPKLSKIIISVIVILLFLLICFYISYISKYKEQIIFNDKLESQLVKNPEISIKDITEFEWDKVCVHLSYSLHMAKLISPQSLVPQEYALIGTIPEIDSDGLWAVSFINSKQKSIRYLEINAYSFSRKYQFQDCYNSNAELVLQKDSNEETYFIIIKNGAN